MPSDMDNLRKAHDDLMTLEAEIQDKQVNDLSVSKSHLHASF
jgi:Holliday junction resolvase RusA-like endonuclease